MGDWLGFAPGRGGVYLYRAGFWQMRTVPALLGLCGFILDVFVVVVVVGVPLFVAAGWGYQKQLVFAVTFFYVFFLVFVFQRKKCGGSGRRRSWSAIT